MITTPEQEIIETNRLIGEFLGYKINSSKRIFFEAETIIGQYYLDKLYFHTSWDWLMPVVEKIESIGANVIIGRFFCDIKYQDPLYQSKYFEIRIASGIKINAVIGAVVEFIKWYNANK